jgi:hypothetical protein
MYIGLCPACRRGDHADHQDVHSLPPQELIDQEVCGGGMCLCICVQGLDSDAMMEA